MGRPGEGKVDEDNYILTCFDKFGITVDKLPNDFSVGVCSRVPEHVIGVGISSYWLSPYISTMEFVMHRRHIYIEAKHKDRDVPARKHKVFKCKTCSQFRLVFKSVGKLCPYFYQSDLSRPHHVDDQVMQPSLFGIGSSVGSSFAALRQGEPRNRQVQCEPLRYIPTAEILRNIPTFVSYVTSLWRKGTRNIEDMVESQLVHQGLRLRESDQRHQYDSLVRSTYTNGLSKQQVRKCVGHVMEIIRKRADKNYADYFPQYFGSYLRSNPDVTGALQLDSQDRFYRMFISIPKAKKIFTEYCIPYLFTDGCHSKTPLYDGVQLLFIGKNGNGRNVPIAVAWVPTESPSHCFWALQMVSMTGIKIDSIPICSDRGNLLSSVRAFHIVYKVTISLKFCLEHVLRNVSASFGLNTALTELLNQYLTCLHESREMQTFFIQVKNLIKDLNQVSRGDRKRRNGPGAEPAASAPDSPERKPGSNLGFYVAIYLLKIHPRHWTVWANHPGSPDDEDALWDAYANNVRDVIEKFCPELSAGQLAQRQRLTKYANRFRRHQVPAGKPFPLFGIRRNNSVEGEVQRMQNARERPPQYALPSVIDVFQKTLDHFRNDNRNLRMGRFSSPYGNENPAHDPSLQAFLMVRERWTSPLCSLTGVNLLYKASMGANSFPAVGFPSFTLVDNGETTSQPTKIRLDHRYRDIEERSYLITIQWKACPVTRQPRFHISCDGVHCVQYQSPCVHCHLVIGYLSENQLLTRIPIKDLMLESLPIYYRLKEDESFFPTIKRPTDAQMSWQVVPGNINLFKYPRFKRGAGGRFEIRRIASRGETLPNNAVSANNLEKKVERRKQHRSRRSKARCSGGSELSRRMRPTVKAGELINNCHSAGLFYFGGQETPQQVQLGKELGKLLRMGLPSRKPRKYTCSWCHSDEHSRPNCAAAQSGGLDYEHPSDIEPGRYMFLQKQACGILHDLPELRGCEVRDHVVEPLEYPRQYDYEPEDNLGNFIERSIEAVNTCMPVDSVNGSEQIRGIQELTVSELMEDDDDDDATTNPDSSLDGEDEPSQGPATSNVPSETPESTSIQVTTGGPVLSDVGAPDVAVAIASPGGISEDDGGPDPFGVDESRDGNVQDTTGSSNSPLPADNDTDGRNVYFGADEDIDRYTRGRELTFLINMEDNEVMFPFPFNDWETAWNNSELRQRELGTINTVTEPQETLLPEEWGSKGLSKNWMTKRCYGLLSPGQWLNDIPINLWMKW